jgi:hypothetical protein
VSQLLVSLVGASLVAVLVFVAAPGAFLRLGLLLYPKGHEKRAEFRGELHYVRRHQRPGWVAGQLLHCLRERPLVRLLALKWRHSIKQVQRLWLRVVVLGAAGTLLLSVVITILVRLLNGASKTVSVLNPITWASAGLSNVNDGQLVAMLAAVTPILAAVMVSGIVMYRRARKFAANNSTG